MRCGVLWPPNAHFHLPIAEQAAGGTMLTGFGGDELLDSGWVWSRLNQALAGRRRWQRRDGLRLLVAYGPKSLRAAALRRQLSSRFAYPWLRPEASRQIMEIAIRDRVTEPVRWDVGVDRAWWRTRYRRTVERSLERLAAPYDVTIMHPLADPVVLAAVAREGGRAGFPSRTAGMQHLVGDLLPAELPTRRTKALLTGAFWNRYSREFTATWDGTGVDTDIVDVEGLRRMWRAESGPPDARSSCLLQSAWLASVTAGRTARGVPN